MANTTLTFGTDRMQALDALREIVRRVENGDMEILDMTVEREAPETRDFRTVNGDISRQMVVRNGSISVALRLSQTDRMRSDLRGDVSLPSSGVTGMTVGPAGRNYRGKMFSEMSREELMQVAGLSPADQSRIMDEISRESFEGVEFPRPQTTPQEPADPLRYGARKLDID